jgi:hypothetical protein
MSLQTGIELPSVKTTSELQDLFPEETMVKFLFDSLSRSERFKAFEDGADRALGATAYLLSGGETDFNRAVFAIGHIAEPQTRAAHILNHAGFTWMLDKNDSVVFDQITRSYRPALLDLDVIDLEAVCSQDSEPALYELPEHHDLEGNPGVISYVIPEVKAAYEQYARTRLLEAEAAKRLVAQA